MSITAALIAKNEDSFIGGCMESIRNLVDEVVVVDTGSEDRTREIAAQHGARLYDVPWTGDFAAARNKAIERATCEWILYIDADRTNRMPFGNSSRESLR